MALTNDAFNASHDHPVMGWLERDFVNLVHATQSLVRETRKMEANFNEAKTALIECGADVRLSAKKCADKREEKVSSVLVLIFFGPSHYHVIFFFNLSSLFSMHPYIELFVSVSEHNKKER